MKNKQKNRLIFNRSKNSRTYAIVVPVEVDRINGVEKIKRKLSN